MSQHFSTVRAYSAAAAVAAAEILNTGLVDRGAQAVLDIINSNRIVLLAFRKEELGGVSNALIVTDLKDYIPPGQKVCGCVGLPKRFRICS